ncbi:MAG: phosphoribosylanthranilate isomerase [Desulfobacterales bacterium]|nr:phosphoribosylanthranilate isomerase [Desulfobacterales bacterium]
MFKASPRIKICGITREADAQLAAGLGADAVGFVLAESPRRIEPEAVRKISMSLPPFVTTVGVFVDADIESVRRIAAFCKLDWVQLHGNESPDYCRALDLKLVKAIRVKDRQSIEAAAAYKDCVKGILLDTLVKGRHGGTGKSFDWDLAKEAKKYGPVILSGGLGPENVKEAIRTVKPYGVDVSSGVESSPGIKDHERMRSFVEQIRSGVFPLYSTVFAVNHRTGGSTND